MKILERVIEALFWFMNFISPLLGLGMVAGVVYLSGNIIPAVIIGLLGIYLGVRFANKMMREHGSSNFYSKAAAFDDVEPIDKAGKAPQDAAPNQGVDNDK